MVDQRRTNPIPETIQAIPTLPTTAKLYRIAASRYWQVRVFKGKRLLRKSTKAESLADAIKFAKNFYDEILYKETRNIPLVESPTFEKVVTDLLKEDEGKVARGERKKRLVYDQKIAFNKDILPFFRKMPLKDINYQHIQGFIAHLRTTGEHRKKPLGSKSIVIYLGYLKKVLKHAAKLNLLDKQPIFPEVRRVDTPRQWFSGDDYELLKVTLRNAIKKKVVVRGNQITDELRLLCSFMISTFTRVSDINILKNRDIKIKKKGKHNYLLISLTSKVKERDVVSLASAVGVFNELQKINARHGFGKPDDYTFFPAFQNRRYAWHTMNRQFNYILKKSNLKKSSQGRVRSLGSLRHTSIMFAADASEMDHLTLASNARTSVDMLERHYLSHRTPEMNVARIQSKRKF